MTAAVSTHPRVAGKETGRSLRAQRAAVIAVAGSMVAGLMVTSMPTAQAAACPPASVGGKPVAHVIVGDARVPVKPVSFRPGGALEPPRTNQAAGISQQHAALDAEQGTTVISWHVRYGPGCDGTLNSLITAPIGSQFAITATNGPKVAYRITDRVTVPKGKYRAAWFDQSGPRRVVLFTCVTLRGGEFTDTVAVFAEPVTVFG